MASFGWTAQTSASRSRPTTGPVTIPAPSTDCVSSQSRRSSPRGGVVCAAAYPTTSGPMFTAELPEGLGDLPGDDEDLVGLALGELGKHLQVRVAQQPLVW